jgi:hypothetical protein
MDQYYPDLGLIFGGFGFQPPQPRTSVGGEFVAFVNATTRSNFPYSADSPVRREVTDVFNGRKVRLMMICGHPDQRSKQWVEGQVVCLYEWNNGPYDFDIKWSIKITSAHFGSTASRIHRTFRIHRISVGWGGTLLPSADELQDADFQANGGVPDNLISFEWVGDLPQGAPRAFEGDGTPCPCCRATEPPTAWPPGEDAAELVIESGECPICLVASRRCVVLHCAHTVCLRCWGECRSARENVGWEGAEGLNAGAAAAEEEEEEDDDDDDEAMLGIAMSPSAERRLEATRAASRAQFATQRMEGGDALNEHMRLMIESMLEDATSGVLGRARLWKKVMTLPIFCCLDDGVRDNVRRLGNVALMRAYIRAIPLRTKCILRVLTEQRDDDVAAARALQVALRQRFERDPGSLSYQELQTRSKGVGIRANQKRAALVKSLTAHAASGGDASASTSTSEAAASTSAPRAKRRKKAKALGVLPAGQPVATPRPLPGSAQARAGSTGRTARALVCDDDELAQVSVLLFTVTFYANHAHNLTRSP